MKRIIRVRRHLRKGRPVRAHWKVSFAIVKRIAEREGDDPIGLYSEVKDEDFSESVIREISKRRFEEYMTLFDD